MALLWSVVSFTFSLFITPLLMFLLGMIFLASINKSLGVRRLYVKILLKIFEYGKQHIEIAQRGNDDPDDEDAGGGPKAAGNNNNMVITRETILLPDPENNIGNNNIKVEGVQYSDNERGDNNETNEPQRREFELSDCLEYVRSGLEAIIEDQVTSRFEAEELRSWNLLTRTNHHYEFISWRLTVIWVFGFIMRYTFLLPLRILICFFGLLFMVVSTGIIGFLPKSKFKSWVTAQAMMISFRIMLRALSVVINFHCREHKPKPCSIVVANHTTTVDVGILSHENAFSLTLWLTLCTAIVGYFPDGAFKRWLTKWVYHMCFGILSSALSADFEYHNIENRPKNGICVANHTSPIDCLVLASDHTYSLIGQRHGGFLGILQRALARASPHIWFERSETKDRHAVTKRLKLHVSDPNNPPILIFPEGTCINNTSVMQFKKGSFEVGSTVYPVAIKYDPRFGDAFWNSSKYSMLQYLYCMMTSWAIVCDVWYLPPMNQMEGESSIDFANRVKHAIAEQGGLVDLMWDGQLKRSGVKKEWKEKQQEEFSRRLKVE